MILYTIQKGDTLYQLAKSYKTTVSRIATVNGLDINDTLIVGQGLIIPSNTSLHVVKSGESLYSISQTYKLDINDLLKMNPQIKKPYIIYPGQELLIDKEEVTNKSNLLVNCYLFESNPKLIPNSNLITFGSCFSYFLKNDGSLSPFNDTNLINFLDTRNIQPIMVVTNTNEKGSFSTSLCSSILNDENKKKTLIENIFNTLKQKEYYGVNIDFEYVDTKDKQKYIQFLKDLKERLDGQFELSVALAPKYSSSQEGLLYEAHDYEAIGKIADRIIIMTYEWGYTYGPAMAVAPLNLVEKVISYAVSVINPHKINMGIPTYGYDFLVPYEKGNKAKSLSYESAIALAKEKKASILYQKEAETPYFIYYEKNQKHEVYYEDCRSIAKKIALASQYNLGGISFWTLRSPFIQMWTVINSLVNVTKIK